MWTADGNTLFVNNELNCTVTIANFDPDIGKLLAVETVNTLPDGVPGTRAHHRGNSDIHLHPNGKFLYVGIRSPDPALSRSLHWGRRRTAGAPGRRAWSWCSTSRRKGLSHGTSSLCRAREMRCGSL